MQASKQTVPKPFRILRKRIYSANRCFYCNKLLKSSHSKEHVFPQWLQDRFGIRDKTITLINGTRIQYAKLTVPCCKPCNNVHLSKLENRVKTTLFERPLSEAREEAKDIFLWACKILLGILYVERLLPFNRRSPKGRRILPQHMKDAFEMMHFFVQSVSEKIRFRFDDDVPAPGSVFIFDLKEFPDPERQFDFRDDLNLLSIYMRLGNRGIIAVFDGGAQELVYGKAFRKDGERPLHPTQFAELGATSFYLSSLFNRTPKYLISYIRGVYDITQLPLGGLSPAPIFDKWEHPHYAHFLSFFTGIPIEILAPDDGQKVMQWKFDRDGNPLDMPIESS